MIQVIKSFWSLCATDTAWCKQFRESESIPLGSKPVKIHLKFYLDQFGYKWREEVYMIVRPMR